MRCALQGTVAQFSSQMEKLNGEDDCKSILDRLKAHDDQLTDIKSKEETLRSKLSDLRAKDDAKNSDIPQLQQVLHCLGLVSAFGGLIAWVAAIMVLPRLRLLRHIIRGFELREWTGRNVVHALLISLPFTQPIKATGEHLLSQPPQVFASVFSVVEFGVVYQAATLVYLLFARLPICSTIAACVVPGLTPALCIGRSL